MSISSYTDSLLFCFCALFFFSSSSSFLSQKYVIILTVVFFKYSCSFKSGWNKGREVTLFEICQWNYPAGVILKTHSWGTFFMRLCFLLTSLSGNISKYPFGLHAIVKWHGLSIFFTLKYLKNVCTCGFWIPNFSQNSWDVSNLWRNFRNFFYFFVWKAECFQQLIDKTHQRKLCKH